MKALKYFLLSLFALFLCVDSFAQTVTLTFSGRDAQNQYIQLNRVMVSNITRGWQETIEWPDTVLIMQDGTGIEEMAQTETLPRLSQNNPNPFNGITDVTLTLAAAGTVTLQIAEVNGRIVRTCDYANLQPGIHHFRLVLESVGTYIMSARQHGKTSSIKMVCNAAGTANKIDYQGIVSKSYRDASTTGMPDFIPRVETSNPFVAGDQMEFVGYATIGGNEFESHIITQPQQTSESFQLQFDAVLPAPVDGLPCPSTPTLTDVDGNVYSTLQLGNQCWMKENLRCIHLPNGDPISFGEEHSASVPYYYYPDSNADNQSTYGLLYNWSAVLNGESASGSTPSGVQGICPDGWHVPSKAEWTVLTGYVGSRSQYQCNGESEDIGKALADTCGWNAGVADCSVGNNQTANNATGFTGMPTGGFVSSGIANFGKYAMFWTCTANGENADAVYLGYSTAMVGMPSGGYSTTYGFGMRCVRDEGEGGGSSDESDLNSCPVSSPNVNETSSGNRITSIRDYDNNSYGVVQIGNQCWMKNNLRTKHYADGTSISQGFNSMFALTTSVSYFFYPDGNASNESSYGLLYNWKAAVRNISSASNANPSGVQGVCPNGWHLPSEAEYAQLTEYVQSQSEYICNPSYSTYVAVAFASNEAWSASSVNCSPGNNPVVNNATGFGAYPAGQWAQEPSGINQYASYWGASGSAETAYSWNIMMSHPYPIVSYDMSDWAYSVRCVRD